MPTLLLALALLLAPPAYADAATEQYAPVQLGVARELLERARARAALGEVVLAARLAWQASFDARLAWGMTESQYLRAEAAEVGGAASTLLSQLAARR